MPSSDQRKSVIDQAVQTLCREFEQKLTNAVIVLSPNIGSGTPPSNVRRVTLDQMQTSLAEVENAIEEFLTHLGDVVGRNGINRRSNILDGVATQCSAEVHQKTLELLQKRYFAVRDQITSAYVISLCTTFEESFNDLRSNLQNKPDPPVLSEPIYMQIAPRIARFWEALGPASNLNLGETIVKDNVLRSLKVHVSNGAIQNIESLLASAANLETELRAAYVRHICQGLRTTLEELDNPETFIFLAPSERARSRVVQIHTALSHFEKAIAQTVGHTIPGDVRRWNRVTLTRGLKTYFSESFSTDVVLLRDHALAVLKQFERDLRQYDKTFSSVRVVSSPHVPPAARVSVAKLANLFEEFLDTINLEELPADTHEIRKLYETICAKTKELQESVAHEVNHGTLGENWKRTLREGRLYDRLAKVMSVVEANSLAERFKALIAQGEWIALRCIELHVQYLTSSFQQELNDIRLKPRDSVEAARARILEVDQEKEKYVKAVAQSLGLLHETKQSLAYLNRDGLDRNIPSEKQPVLAVQENADSLKKEIVSTFVDNRCREVEQSLERGETVPLTDALKPIARLLDHSMTHFTWPQGLLQKFTRHLHLLPESEKRVHEIANRCKESTKGQRETPQSDFSNCLVPRGLTISARIGPRPIETYRSDPKNSTARVILPPSKVRGLT